MLDYWIKDPQAVLDYAFTWADWLAAGETITTHTVTATTGLTVASSAESAGVVTAWLSGGTAGATYTVTCHIETSAGRKDDRSKIVKVLDR